MEKLANVHPGEILNFEFLEPLVFPLTMYKDPEAAHTVENLSEVNLGWL